MSATFRVFESEYRDGKSIVTTIQFSNFVSADKWYRRRRLDKFNVMLYCIVNGNTFCIKEHIEGKERIDVLRESMYKAGRVYPPKEVHEITDAVVIERTVYEHN